MCCTEFEVIGRSWALNVHEKRGYRQKMRSRMPIASFCVQAPYGKPATASAWTLHPQARGEIENGLAIALEPHAGDGLEAGLAHV